MKIQFQIKKIDDGVLTDYKESGYCTSKIQSIQIFQFKSLIMDLIKLYLLQNVSPLKMTENQLKEYIVELEEKVVELSLKINNTKKELIAIKSKCNEINNQLIHNLKNPIGSVFSFSEMMLHEKGNGTMEKFDKHLQVIHNSSQFSIALLNKYSIYLDSISKEKMNVEKVDFIPFVEKIVSSYQLNAIQKNNLISFDFGKSQLYLEFNRNDISFVLKALLHNTLRYSREGGKISVEIIDGPFSVSTRITDSGIGISPKDLTKVFTPFFVVNTYSEDREKCIGLSLAIVKNILNYHKGSVEIKSKIGKGTSVVFTLPKA